MWEMRVYTNLTRVSQESTEDGQRCKDNIRVAHKEIGVCGYALVLCGPG